MTADFDKLFAIALLKEALWHLDEHNKEYQHVTPALLMKNIKDYIGEYEPSDKSPFEDMK